MPLRLTPRMRGPSLSTHNAGPYRVEVDIGLVIGRCVALDGRSVQDSNVHFPRSYCGSRHHQTRAIEEWRECLGGSWRSRGWCRADLQRGTSAGGVQTGQVRAALIAFLCSWSRRSPV